MMKSINLLPKEYKRAELRVQLKKGVIFLCLLIVLHFAFLGFGVYRLKGRIAELNEGINEGKRLKSSIEVKKQELFDKELFLENLDETLFPFYDFVKFLVVNKPSDLNLISVDTLDRMWGYEEGYLDTSTDAGSDKSSDENVDEGVGEDADADADADVEGEETTEEVIEPVDTIKATNISEMMIVIRGSSKDVTSISNYIYKISLLDYVKDISLTAIEKMETPNGEENVFEIVLDVE